MSIKRFSIIGIAIRTTNEGGKSGKDIPQLWNKFISENIGDRIPNKLDNAIYCVYTDYEKDHTKPYTTIIGCKVSGLDEIPNDMIGKTIENSTYEKFTAKGNLTEGAVYNEWLKIWNSDLNRSFTSDFEVYDQRSANLQNGEVDIYIALK
ncbi:GyrI-like domain-containing protein [Flavobacterium ginsenosidimutans]|uniref:GyrI-like domain-containing protein n=1 Tax=Flavobacterium ginsenosidimutans TaxID=687844 RepID=A0ABZ2QFI5_9FLAO|nr:GyrI-like domain-containing protein [Flavobacterium ginsenosidimutans]KAF2334669.1 AraC family transcriptional regulator [Flavobacterium ginsenosidimutans]